MKTIRTGCIRPVLTPCLLILKLFSYLVKFYIFLGIVSKIPYRHIIKLNEKLNHLTFLRLAIEVCLSESRLCTFITGRSNFSNINTYVDFLLPVGWGEGLLSLHLFAEERLRIKLRKQIHRFGVNIVNSVLLIFPKHPHQLKTKNSTRVFVGVNVFIFPRN